MPASIQTAAAQLLQALQENEMFPNVLQKTMSVDEAYDTQFELLELRQAKGDVHTGWKVGLTSKAMQIQQGVHEPCLGHLVRDGHEISPVTLAFDEMMEPGFENELCIRMKSKLSGESVSIQEAFAAIDAVAPAIEVIEKRGVFNADFPLALAGNAQQRAFVTGPFKTFTSDMDLTKIKVDIIVNGEHQEASTGAEVLGNPVQSIIWLAKKLAQYGRVLNPGDMIMSGSFTKQYSVNKGDTVRADFTELGAVDIEFG